MTTAIPQRTSRDLNALVKLQAILERARISSSNQNRSIMDPRVAAITQEIEEVLRSLEGRLETQMAETVKTHPAWFWLTKVKGIGPQAGSLCLAYLLPPLEEKGPSSWYKAAGLYAIIAEDGTSRMPRYQHLAEGQRATWHPRLRRNLYVVGTCLLRAGGFYHSFYSDVKAALEIKHSDWMPQPPKTLRPGDQVHINVMQTQLDEWGIPNALRFILSVGESIQDSEIKDAETLSPEQLNHAKRTRREYLEKMLLAVLRQRVPIDSIFTAVRDDGSTELLDLALSSAGRCHSVAFWKMVKLFLAHLYEVWAKAEGIPVREPYPMEILGHRKIHVPEDGG